MSSFPKSSQGAYCAVVNHVPKLSRTAAEQILADYEGYAASGTQSTYKKAQKLAVRFGKFKTSRAGRQLEAQQVWLRTPVTRLDAPARSTTPSTTPLPVAGVKHGRPPSSPTTSNANGVHNRVTPNKAPHKKPSAGRGVVLADPVRRALNDPPAPRRTSQLDLGVRQENKRLLAENKALQKAMKGAMKEVTKVATEAAKAAKEAVKEAVKEATKVTTEVVTKAAMMEAKKVATKVAKEAAKLATKVAIKVAKLEVKVQNLALVNVGLVAAVQKAQEAVKAANDKAGSEVATIRG